MRDWLQILSRAWHDTWEIVVGQPLRSIIISLIIFLLARKLIVQIRGKDAGKEMVHALICTTAATTFVGIIIFFFQLFIIAPVNIYHEQTAQILDLTKDEKNLQKRLDDKSPRLEGFIDQNMIGEEVGTSNTIVFLQVSIANSGGSPSVATDYKLKAMLTNNNVIDASPIDFSDQYSLNAFSTNTLTVFTLKRPELISEKTAKGIQPGDEPRGWIAYKLPGSLLNSYKNTNLTLVLSFFDINGNQVFVTNGLRRGKPSKIIPEEAPLTLPGSENLVSQSLTYGELAAKAKALPWQPPDLPTGCSNVTIYFGNERMDIPLLFAEISPEQSGTKFLIKDLPDIFLKDADKMTHYSPHQKYMWIRWEFTKQDYGGKTVSLPISPFVISNRFYIEVELPYSHERHKVVMSDEFDTELSNLPKLWDWNYGTNVCAYEIVNENTNPVLQVFYTEPNVIHVNGVFILDTNSVLQSFGGPPQLQTVTNYKYINLTNMQEITNISEYLGTNSVGEFITNAFYNSKYPNQKAIFKYPSNRNPGVLAD